MVNKFFNFLIESVNGIELSYYAFDIDDNLFHMPTVIHMEKLTNSGWVEVDVSTHEFAKVRNDENYRLKGNNPDLAFCEFRDTGPRGNMAFIEDMKIAIENGDFGPSWGAFTKCLEMGAIFALITARGNEPITYRKAVEYIIDNVLSNSQKYSLYNNCLKHYYLFNFHKIDEIERIPKGNISSTKLISRYLDSCDFWGVSSKSFANEFGEATASNPEKAKELALDSFIEKCNKWGKQVGAKSVSIGFSDDDPKNVEHVNKYFSEKITLTSDLPHKVKFSLYKTTDRKIKGGERKKFYSDGITETSHQAPGLENSILSFTKWNNMTQRLYPNSKDAPTDDYHNQMKNNVNQIIDLQKQSIKKRRKINKNKKPKNIRKI